jgi:hypothetical protein
MTSGKLSPDGETMNESRLLLQNVWPEGQILKLKLHRACHFAVALGDKKLPNTNVGSNAGR